MAHEQAPVGAREAAQVVAPVVRGRFGLEAAEDPVEERVDELVLGGEVVVQRHRYRPQSGCDRTDRERVETVCGDGLGGVEDRLGRKRPPGTPRSWVRLARLFRHVLDFG
jgi:hypothetical protein